MAAIDLFKKVRGGEYGTVYTASEYPGITVVIDRGSTVAHIQLMRGQKAYSTALDLMRGHIALLDDVIDGLYSVAAIEPAIPHKAPQLNTFQHGK